MGTIRYFITECKNFSRNNWWVYIVYFILLVVIFYFQKGDLLNVIITTSVHFIADMFIMMMFNAYAHSDYSRGTYYQIISLLLFLSIKIYTGFKESSWQYLTADPIYILAAIKNYQIDVKKSDLKIINTVSMTILSILILSLALNSTTIFIDAKDQQFSFPRLFQTIGIFLFAIALSTTANEKLRYEISLVALFIMVGGSAWVAASNMMGSNAVGLDISYTLLPLTVLLYYLRKWPVIMKTKVLTSLTDVAVKPQ